MEGTMPMGRPQCVCPHHKIVPAIIALAVIVFGGAFLFYNLGLIGIAAREILWPLAIVVAGVTKLAAHACTCCRRGCGHC
ncbi:hypothetical protein EPN90_04640 [Patescibacteria group bacterium]|nr:MAG: hypothetical protein EPN90_04640 [Patescibacteria group bacterium]